MKPERLKEIESIVRDPDEFNELHAEDLAAIASELLSEVRELNRQIPGELVITDEASVIALPVDVLHGILRAATRNETVARELDALRDDWRAGYRVIAAAILQAGQAGPAHAEGTNPARYADEFVEEVEALVDMVIRPHGIEEFRAAREEDDHTRASSGTMTE